MQAIFAYIINGKDIPEKVAGVRHIFNRHLRGWGQACVIEKFFLVKGCVLPLSACFSSSSGSVVFLTAGRYEQKTKRINRENAEVFC